MNGEVAGRIVRRSKREVKNTQIVISAEVASAVGTKTK
jgi:hypothetical protein